MRLSFSAVNENADEHEIPFRPKNENESHLCGAYITELRSTPLHYSNTTRL